jgi:DNA-binding CsgD family transcriptional regulator
VLLRDQEARRWAEEALAVARAVGSPAGEAQALLPLVILARRQGDMDTARTLAHQMRERAAAAGERSRELEAQGHLGRIELDLGNLTAAGAALDEAVTLAEASGLVWSPAGVEARILRIIAHYDAGDWDGAERLAVAVDDRSPAAAPLSAASMYVEVGRGRPSAAERFARLEPRREEDTYVAYLTGGCAADLALWQGDLDRAVTVARSTLAMLDRDAESWMLSSIWPATIGLAAEADRAEQARTAGDANAEGAARASGAAFLATARADLVRADQAGIQVGPEALAWLARAEAEAERLEGRSGVAQWRAAADGFTYGYVYEEARSRWRLAEALLLEGLRDEALAEVRTAHATAERLGAEPLRAAVEALARRARLDLGQGVPEHPGTAGLTPRELEVLRLVAAGRSNSQIAGELFISPKTASVHVSNILAKLGVHSRVEAAATAYRLGLDGIHASPGS